MATLLVIDAYAGFREAMAYCLPKFGHRPLEAENLSAAGLLAATRRIDAVVLAAEGGGERETWVNAERRAAALLGDLPVVLLVSQVTPAIVERARRDGIQVVMPKLFEWADFVREVERLRCGGDATRDGV